MNITYDFILIFVGILVGFINTLAGGGSSVLYPILIFMGMPIHTAIGTSRVGFIAQGIFSVAGFKSKGIFIFPFNLYAAVAAMTGGLIGAWISLQVPSKNLTRILAFIMIMIAFLILIQAKINNHNKKYRISGKWLWISLIVYFFIGMYGGFIQAGMGFMIILAGTLINHFNLTQANSIKALIVLILTIPTLLMFALEDKVNWQAGFAIAIGTALGSWLTSRWSVSVNEKYIRIFIAFIIVILAGKLYYFPI
jgi:uncharacterized membrane protein YfcA